MSGYTEFKKRQRLFDQRAQLRRAQPRNSLARTTSRRIALIVVLIAGAASSATAQVDSNAIMGFETPLGWIAEGNAASGTTVSATAIRTQGKSALAIANPSDLLKLTSLPVASTAKALAGVGNAGAVFEVDVMLPTQQGNPVNQGHLLLFISSTSRNLNNVNIGRVRFTGLRLGIYTTMKFPIPDDVRNALGGATFSDLTFQFMLSSPGTGDGTYRFDNLRVHSVPPISATPPAGYGGSVDFVVTGSTPVAQLFDIGIVQVPDSFHLKLGTAGSTTVQLDLGYDGTPAFTCTYGADPTDPSGKSYRFTSCTGGMQPGDLVGADWARLTIVGGDASMKIRAQLAGNPVGDLVGGGIIPPMPTFWGDFDGCIPAPVPGQAVTISPSCASQTAEASQIISDYFDKVNNSSPPLDWVVTPPPEFARRHGDGQPHNNLTGPPPPPNDPPVPFDFEDHLNAGGDWDAYWRLNGNFDPEYIGGRRSTTHFDATLGAHAVLFGFDADIVDAKAALNTDTNPLSPSASGSVDLFIFGLQVRHVGADPSMAFNLNEGFSGEQVLSTVQIWIFKITVKAGYDVGLAVSGGVAPEGPNVALGPSVSVDAHIEGGINIGVASGSVDAKVNLISVGTPVTAQAKWTFNNDPTVCAGFLNDFLDGQAKISSLGGEVDLVATFGPCPFCYKASQMLFKWDPIIAGPNLKLFNTQVANQAFQIQPTALCAEPLTVKITSPTQGATVSALPVTLSGFASLPNFPSAIPCSGYSWSFSPPAHGNVSSVTGTCSPTVTFDPTTSQAINLSVSHTFTDQFGRSIPVSGNATPVFISVTQLAPGVYITELVDTNGQPFTPSGGTISIIPVFGVPQTYTIQGLVVGASGTLSTSFTASGGVISNVNASGSMPAATWTPPTQCPSGPSSCTNTGTHTITMTTTAGGSPFGTDSVTVIFNIIQ